MKRNFIEMQYTEKLFHEIWQQHAQLIDDLKSQRKFAVRILAGKSR
jgi:hypothetical protein